MFKMLEMNGKVYCIPFAESPVLSKGPLFASEEARL